MKEPLTIIYLKLTSGKVSILQGVTALNCLQKQPASSSTLQIASRKKKKVSKILKQIFPVSSRLFLPPPRNSIKPAVDQPAALPTLCTTLQSMYWHKARRISQNSLGLQVKIAESGHILNELHFFFCIFSSS